MSGPNEVAGDVAIGCPHKGRHEAGECLCKEALMTVAGNAAHVAQVFIAVSCASCIQAAVHLLVQGQGQGGIESSNTCLLLQPLAVA